MAGIYQAEMWCDDCAEAIAKDLIQKGQFPSYWTESEKAQVIENEGDAAGIDADSDDWPNWGHDDHEESDSPQHCGANSECLNKIDLCEYGFPENAPLYGAEDRYVGAIVSSLTTYGAEGTAEMIRETPRTPYQKALHKLWREFFSDELCGQDLGSGEDEEEEQNYELSLKFAVNAVQCVMMLLGNQKRRVVQELFGEAERGYQLEWMHRNPFEFWCHLDGDARKLKVVRMAIEFYTNQD